MPVGKNIFFRSTLFGGYDKKEVDAYIEELEKKGQNYEEESRILREQRKSLEDARDKIEELRRENERLTKEMRIYEAQKDAVSKVLLDANVNANVIVEKANSEAKGIITQAEQESEKRSREMEEELQKEFKRRIDEFVSIKCRLTDQQENLSEACGKLGELLDFLTNIEQSIPDYLEEILKEETEDGSSQSASI